MDSNEQREALARLIRDRREGFAGLSRMIGRNPAYIQQFIKRGTPRKLEEADRRTLAAYFGVADSDLGGPSGPSAGVPSSGAERRDPRALISIPVLDVGASAGPGAHNEHEGASAHIGFEEKWLRRLSGGKPADLSLIRVQGDSMSPTLSDGDDILVDAGDATARLRDGIYVLRRDDALLVKRISPNPASRRISIRSDNASYPSWPDCRPGDIDIIGRVVWVGRKLH